MKTFKRVQRSRLSEVIANEIEEAILSGTFIVGSRLPSEQELADQFEVSRNVVREGLKILQERGLVETLTGSGAFVAQPNPATTSSALGRYLRLTGVFSSIRGLYEARRILESWNARLAAERAGEEDLDTLASCLERMRQHAGVIDKWVEADLEFHLTIAKATGNPFLRILLEPLVDNLREVIMEGYLVPGAVETGLRAHEELYQQIRQQDSERAANTMIEHLRDSEARVESFLRQVSPQDGKLAI